MKFEFIGERRMEIFGIEEKMIEICQRILVIFSFSFSILSSLFFYEFKSISYFYFFLISDIYR